MSERSLIRELNDLVEKLKNTKPEIYGTPEENPDPLLAFLSPREKPLPNPLLVAANLEMLTLYFGQTSGPSELALDALMRALSKIEKSMDPNIFHDWATATREQQWDLHSSTTGRFMEQLNNKAAWSSRVVNGSTRTLENISLNGTDLHATLSALTPEMLAATARETAKATREAKGR